MAKKIKSTKIKSTKNEESVSMQNTETGPEQITTAEAQLDEKVSASLQKKTKRKAKSSNDTNAIRHSKRFSAITTKVNKTKLYPIDEAVALAKQTATTKFLGSIEAHLVVSQKGLRGIISFPHPTGRQITILAFADVPGRESVIVGNDDTIEKIQHNKLSAGRDFTIVITTPAYMPKLTKIAKILGPKGLMPNPKSGTLTDKPEAVIKDLISGQVEYKTEQNAPLVHIAVGKTNLDEMQIKQNLQSLITTIGTDKIQSLSINASMGPGIKVKYN